MVRIFKCIILLIGCFSCATGPKAEKKSPLNYLSGDHYDSDITSGVLPIRIERKRKNTSLSGDCFFQRAQDDFKYPAKFQRIILLKEQKEVASSSTDGNGHFEINSYLKNGEYELALDSVKYRGKKRIDISKYSHEKISLEVSKK